VASLASRWPPIWLDGTPLFPSAVLTSGWLGVNLFFVDSGFVLALPFARGSRAMSGAGDLFAFWRRRALRLLPLYYLTLAVGAVAASARGAAPSPRDLLALVTFAYPAMPGLFLPRLDPSLWSIGIEVWFSLLFPALPWLAHRIGLARLLALAVIVSTATRALASSLQLGAAVGTLGAVADSLPGRLDNFVLGVVAAYLFAGGSLRTFFGRHRFLQPAAFASAVLCLVVSGQLWEGVAMSRGERWAPVVANALANGGFFLLLTGAVSGFGGAVTRALSVLPLRWLGIGCYGIYLWHWKLLAPLGLPGQLEPWRVTVYVAITLALSAIGYRLVEKPLMKR
jgi:peptidoglycan/LPS O-acetylase OafA/YrhL